MIVFAYPSFQRKYGNFVGVSDETPSGYQLTAAWQAGIGQSAGVGTFFGTLLNGYLVAKFGAKKTLLGALVAMSCFLLIPFFAPSKQVLIVGQVLNGWANILELSSALLTDLQLSLGHLRHHCTGLCIRGATYCAAYLHDFL